MLDVYLGGWYVEKVYIYIFEGIAINHEMLPKAMKEAYIVAQMLPNVTRTMTLLRFSWISCVSDPCPVRGRSSDADGGSLVVIKDTGL